jgi:hypothetical protein
MSDNTQLPPGSGGDEIRTIDHGTAKTQVVALDAGGESSESLVTKTNPLPVAQRDEFGNQVDTSAIVPIFLQILDEIRAIRIGIQILCEYASPTSGTPSQPTIPQPRIGCPVGGNEVDLITAAQDMRDDF